MNVLIVEDESLIATELERIATNAGHTTIGPVSTMEQALAFAPMGDVAIIDLTLADGESGAKLAPRLIDRFSMPVVFVTGNPEGVGVGRDGATDVVSKPFTDERIVAALSRAKAQKHAIRG